MMTSSMKRNIFLSLLPAIVIFTIFLVIPILIMGVTSFFSWTGSGLEFVGTFNYERLFTRDRAYGAALRNTLVWIGVALFIHIPLAVLVAMILSKKIRGWKIFRTLFFIPNIVSYASLSIVFLAFYNARYGMLNTTLGSFGLEQFQQDWLFQRETALAAIILTWVFMIGFYMIIILAEIASIPESLYEASAIDGANAWQQDLYITLPLLRNAIGTSMILAATLSLIYFEGIFLMTQGGPANATMNLPMLAYSQYQNFRWGYTNAIGTTILLLGLVFILIIRTVFRVGERH